MNRLARQLHARLDRRRQRRWLLALTLGWPVVVVVGLMLNRIADSHAPAATLPMVWLLVLAFVIERLQMRR
jgi:undecaprenyl pyrophosphate phosphatase UppP